MQNSLLKFSIFHEYDHNEVYASSILPQKEFLQSLLDGAKLFWNKMIEYRIFEKETKRLSRDSLLKELNKIEIIEKKMYRFINNLKD